MKKPCREIALRKVSKKVSCGRNAVEQRENQGAEKKQRRRDVNYGNIIRSGSDPASSSGEYSKASWVPCWDGWLITLGQNSFWWDLYLCLSNLFFHWASLGERREVLERRQDQKKKSSTMPTPTTQTRRDVIYASKIEVFLYLHAETTSDFSEISLFLLLVLRECSCWEEFCPENEYRPPIRLAMLTKSI